MSGDVLRTADVIIAMERVSLGLEHYARLARWLGELAPMAEEIVDALPVALSRRFADWLAAIPPTEGRV